MGNPKEPWENPRTTIGKPQENAYVGQPLGKETLGKPWDNRGETLKEPQGMPQKSHRKPNRKPKETLKQPWRTLRKPWENLGKTVEAP